MINTYYIHPAAFGQTTDPKHGHVAVVLHTDYERLRQMTEALLSEAAEVYRRYNTTQQPDGDLVDFQTLHEVQEVLK